MKRCAILGFRVYDWEMSADTHRFSIVHYTITLWPLLWVYGLMYAMLQLTGTIASIDIPTWLSIVNFLIFVVCFIGAAWWVFLPMSHCSQWLDHPSPASFFKIEKTVSMLPFRAVKGFIAAGLAYVVYFLLIIFIMSAVYQLDMTWRMLISLGFCALYIVAILASMLAVSKTMIYLINMRKSLAQQGVFSGGLETTYPISAMVRTSVRPWVLFAVTSLIPGSILAFYLYLVLGSEQAIEQNFIMQQALLLFSALLIAGTYLVFLVSRMLGKVTTELSSGLDCLRRGQFDGRISVLMDDDLGDLARGLNTALAGLKERDDIKDSLNIAAEIQQALLPREQLDIPSYQMCDLQKSCYAVGGDYYDYIRLPDGRYWLVMADVAGKGYPAALTVANLQAMLHVLANMGVDFEKVATYVNDALVKTMTGGRFVTLFMAKFQPESNSLLWLNAGHLPPMMYHQGEISRLQATSPPMGLVPLQEFEVQQQNIESGDMLLAYTDGITEIRNDAGEMFGEIRLEHWLMQHAEENTVNLPDLLKQTLTEFSSGIQEDDVTMWCLKREIG